MKFKITYLNQELILTPEEIKAVYINYFEE